MSKKLKFLLVGAGYMGRAHARVLSNLGKKYDIKLEAIVDPVRENAVKVASEYGGKVYSSLEEALEEELFDAAIVASPTKTHLNILEKLLDNGIEYLFVEKPLGSSLEEAERVSSKYPYKRLSKIMVGHIERFNPAFTSLLESLESGELGELITIISRRVGPYTPRIKDTGVILDLAIHDIDLSLLMIGRTPSRLYSFVYSRHDGIHEDSALILLDYEDIVHSIEANRITPYKERKMIVTASKGVVRLDFIEQEMSFYTGKWVMKRQISWKEPLLLEDEYFVIKALRGEEVKPNYMDGYMSLKIAFEAMKQGRKRKDSL